MEKNIKKLLISQPEPENLEKSPYWNLIHKYKLKLTFYKFFTVEGISVSEFRKNRIHLTEHTAVIFNSKLSVDHYFRMAKELRESIPETMKYFCTTEQIALYLQNYIQYRKRKIFFGNQFFAELVDVMTKHRDEKFLFPCSDEKQTEYTKLLDKAKFRYTKAPMYRSVPRDLKQFNLKEFDMVVLFSPIGVRSLLKSFPKIANEDILIAAFGTATHSALKQAGITVDVPAPTKSAPSMAMAIENFVQGKEQEAVLVVKPQTLKSKSSSHSRSSSSSHSSPSSTPTTNTKRNKANVASKAKYKQLIEEKKARSAERRAAKAAAKAAENAANLAAAQATVVETPKPEAVTPEKAPKAPAAKTAKTPAKEAKATVKKATTKAKTTTATKKTTAKK